MLSATPAVWAALASADDVVDRARGERLGHSARVVTRRHRPVGVEPPADHPPAHRGAVGEDRVEGRQIGVGDVVGEVHPGDVQAARELADRSCGAGPSPPVPHPPVPVPPVAARRPSPRRPPGAAVPVVPPCRRPVALRRARCPAGRLPPVPVAPPVPSSHSWRRRCRDVPGAGAQGARRPPDRCRPWDAEAGAAPAKGPASRRDARRRAGATGLSSRSEPRALGLAACRRHGGPPRLQSSAPAPPRPGRRSGGASR